MSGSWWASQGMPSTRGYCPRHESGEFFTVAANVQGYAHEFGDVAREDRAAIDHFEGSGDAELVARQVVLAEKLLVDESEPCSIAIQKCMDDHFIIATGDGTVHHQVVTF